MEGSLVKTRANTYKTSGGDIYKRFKTEHTHAEGTYKVLEVRVERGPDKKPLVAQGGGIPLQWKKWVAIGDTLKPIWSERQ